jgi:L-ascorbate metabolism protein UlaG (beta-lactamase superfamily)
MATVGAGLIEAKVQRRQAPLFEQLSNPSRRGTVNMFWLGQAGFAIRTARQLILVDPYLSNALAEKYRDAPFKHTRMMESPLAPDEPRGVDYIFATHAHSDHLDPGSIGKIMALNPECRLVCPKSARGKALERGADPDRIVHLSSLEKRSLGRFSVEMIPSAHEELADDGRGNILFAGYIFAIEGIKLYHSGDCVPYDGLAMLLRERGVNIALLPVNGRDQYRREHGVPGNFTVEEAAELCVEASIPFLIPHHFGMFEFNTVPPEEIELRLRPYRARGLDWRIPSVDEALTARKRD